MYLWEFNLYIKGYCDKLKDNEKSLIKVGYYTASFSRAKKVKALSHYLKKIDESKSEKPKRNNSKLEYARKMFEKTNGST